MNLKRIVLVIILNILIVAAEIIFGVIGNSMGLVSDALHNLSDVIALVISLIAVKFAQREANENMTYGYIRSEMMAGFVNSLFLVAAMIYISVESIGKLMHPEKVEGMTMMIVAGIAVIANSLSVLILRKAGIGHTHHHREHEHKDEHTHEHGIDYEHEHEEHAPDLNTRAMILHLMSDVLISLAVIAGGTAIHFLGIMWIDPLLALAFAAYIILKAIGVFRSAFFSLMDRTSRDVKDIVACLESFHEIKNVHSVHLTEPSSKDIFFSAHIVIDACMAMREVEGLIERVKDELKKKGITHVILQPETDKYSRDSLICDGH